MSRWPRTLLGTSLPTLAGALLDRAEDALVQMMDAIQAAQARGATAEQLAAARALHRKAQ